MIYAINAGKGQNKYYRIENSVYLLQFYYKVSRLWTGKKEGVLGDVSNCCAEGASGVNTYIININFFEGQREHSLGMRTHFRINLYHRSWEDETLDRSI